ncbi:MAG: hypothetical protein Q4D21_00245 [Phascolarctobacterium sp.]|nr:hypothetical protein [Phascolarctobacterium sp.]
MGGKGTYSSGKSPSFTYKKIGEISGIKILAPIDETKALKLPEESHSPKTSYVVLDKNGIFHQFREYNENHEVVLEIGYHHEPRLGTGDVLHVHIHSTPGVIHHREAEKRVIKSGDPIYEKYKFLFKGVN